MSLTNTIALTTLAVVKSELGITTTDDDAFLERAILVASQAIVSYCNRDFRKQSFTERLRANNKQVLVLARTPVASITSISVDGSALPATGDYELDDAEAGTVYRETGWAAANALVYGSAGGDFTPGTDKKRITAVYEGGYVLPNDDSGTRDLPYDLEQACVLTVIGVYRRRGSDRSIASEALGDYSVSYRNPNTAIGASQGGIIPDDALNLLGEYVRPAMVS